jgi:transcriptional regulator of arginine metabolism
VADRNQRQRLIRELVSTHAVSAQSELVTLLGQAGVDATQATVSRDLEDLGITKYRGADGQVSYTLPENGSLAQILRQFARTFDASGNLAVVRTPPGAAAAVASAIDSADLPGVLATVQGDDTLLVVAREGFLGSQIAEQLRQCKERRP